MLRDIIESSVEKCVTFIIDKELKNGNTGRTKHFSAAHKEKRAWNNALPKSEVLLWMRDGDAEIMQFNDFREEILNNVPYSVPIGIAVERVLGKRQRLLDADSILRGNAKELIDSFVFHNILEDDNHKFVKWCVGYQCDQHKDDGPYTKVHFYRSEPRSI